MNHVQSSNNRENHSLAHKDHIGSSHHIPHIPGENKYHHYNTTPHYNSYSIQDFYEKFPPSHLKNVTQSYDKQMHSTDHLFKMYVGGMSIVGLYMFFRMLEQ